MISFSSAARLGISAPSSWNYDSRFTGGLFDCWHDRRFMCAKQSQFQSSGVRIRVLLLYSFRKVVARDMSIWFKQNYSNDRMKGKYYSNLNIEKMYTTGRFKKNI